MVRLTRGERFKDARLERNQHKKQTMDEVAAATGISKSLIQSLEDDDTKRSVGYDKVAKLAEHYGVTADFLLGLSDDPSPRKSAIDELGLSPEAVQWLNKLCSDYKSSNAINDIFTSSAFHLVIENLCDYYNSIIAEIIYDNIFLKHFPDYNDGTATREQLDTFFFDVGNDNTRNLFDSSVTDFLYAQRLIWDNTDGGHPLADVISQGEGFTVSDLAEYRVSKHLQATIRSINLRAREFFNTVIKHHGNDPGNP